jgi:hypothetical protein
MHDGNLAGVSPEGKRGHGSCLGRREVPSAADRGTNVRSAGLLVVSHRVMPSDLFTFEWLTKWRSHKRKRASGL